MLHFKMIEPDDISVLNRFLSDTDEISCENTFINLLVWSSLYHNSYAVQGDTLFIRSHEHGRDIYRLPIGGDLNAGLEELYRFCGAKPDFWIQEGALFDRLPASFLSSYTMTENRDAADYLYSQTDLSELSGKKFHGKRNHISAFSRKNDWHYERIDDRNLPAVLACAEDWYASHPEKADRYLACERQGIDTVLHNMHLFGAVGGALFVNGKAVAFTVGSAISATVFDIHYEKSLPDYPEGYAVINREFARQELSDYRFINREDDLGSEALRKAKMSYQPVRLVKKFTCRSK